MDGVRIEEKFSLSPEEIAMLGEYFTTSDNKPVAKEIVEYITSQRGFNNSKSSPVFLSAYRDGLFLGAGLFMKSDDPAYAPCLMPQQKILRTSVRILQPLVNTITGTLYFTFPDWFTASANPWMPVKVEYLSELRQSVLGYLKKKGFVFIMDEGLDVFTDYEASKYVSGPGIDTCRIDVDTYSDHINTMKWINRKINRFSKRGHIEIITESASRDMVDTLLDCMSQSRSVTNTSNPSITSDMVMDKWLETALLQGYPYISFVSYIEDKITGFQTFVRSSGSLNNFAGGFYRERTNYHSYVNIILKSVEYAKRNNVGKIYMGFCNNEIKDKMTNSKTPLYIFLNSRYSFVKPVLEKIIPAFSVSSWSSQSKSSE